MRPSLVAALAEDRHRRCPGGAVTQQPCRLCGSGRSGGRLEIHDYAAAPPQRFPLNARHIPKTLPIARVMSLFRNTSKGAKG
jgi:hypothetical protein